MTPCSMRSVLFIHTGICWLRDKTIMPTFNRLKRREFKIIKLLPEFPVDGVNRPEPGFVEN